MVVKKMGNKIFGAELTRNEQKALDIEIKKQLAEYDRKNMMEMDSIILWILHSMYGLGEKRLRAFYDNFHTELEALADRYEMDDEDAYLCTENLRRIGIDVEKWHREKAERLSKEL